MELRTATATDIPVLLRILRTTVRRHGKDHYTPEQLEAWASAVTERRLAEHLNEAHVLVAVEEAIVGFGSIQGHHLEYLYVHPDRTRQGIGQQLYDALERRARDQGHTSIDLVASRISKPFFARNGYQAIEEMEKPTQGVPLWCVRMSKWLEPARP